MAPNVNAFTLSFTVATAVLLLYFPEQIEGDGAIRYERYSLFRLKPLSNMTQVDSVLLLREKFEDERTRKVIFFDDIILPLRHPLKIIVSPELRLDVENHLTGANLEFTVTVDDVKKLLAEYHELNDRQRLRYDAALETGRNIAPNFFMNYDEITKLFESWARLFPAIASVSSIGLTTEKRETLIFQINGDQEHLPAVWIDAGIDSRVWISSASAIYIVHELLYRNDDEIVRLRTKYRWFIVPVVNPDGYQYSIEKDRFWRKTRKPYDNGCYGADINRNFDVNWVGSGSTLDPCMDRHRGPRAFSELETQNLADALKRINATSSGIAAYFSFQSYGQNVLAPWTGRDMLKTDDYEYLLVVAKEAIAAVEAAAGLATEAKIFKFGTPPDVRYPISGSVLDWARQTLNIKWLFAVDLAPEALTATNFDEPNADRHPLGVCMPATAIYTGGVQALTIVTRTLTTIEEGPTVDLLEIYAADELARIRQADGDEPKETLQEVTDGVDEADVNDDDVIDDNIDDDIDETSNRAEDRDEL